MGKLYGARRQVGVGAARWRPRQATTVVCPDAEKLGYVKLPEVVVGFDVNWNVTPNIVDRVRGGAEQAGIKAGDSILSVDNRQMKTSYDVFSLLNTKKVGDTVAVKVLRDGNEMVFNPVLTAR